MWRGAKVKEGTPMGGGGNTLVGETSQRENHLVVAGGEGVTLRQWAGRKGGNRPMVW